MKLLNGLLIGRLLTRVWMLALLTCTAGAQEPLPAADGEVRVPLPAYTKILEQAQQHPRPAAAAYAIGESRISVQILEQNDRVSARIDATVLIETFEKQWTMIPILPAGVAVSSATIDEQPVSLVQSPDGLSWHTDQVRQVYLQLAFAVDAQRSASGYVLAVPVPAAAAARMEVLFPGTSPDLAVIPGSDLELLEENGITQASFSVPATPSVMVSWRIPAGRSYALSRAQYRGELKQNALVWQADYQVEVFSGENVILTLLPDTVTLSDIRVDGNAATVLVEEGYFSTLLQGRGMHQVRVDFQVPVEQHDGPPQAYLQIPKVPVSQFDLVLPGRKELTVLPPANIVTSELEDRIEARLFMPMTDSLTFSWQDAIPQDMRTEVRANASLYHALSAEEGVLHARAFIAYEITHGETSTLELEIPDQAQVNRIDGPGISDWSVSPSDNAGYNLITIFLDRPISDSYALEVAYERLLGSGAEAAEPLAVPLLRAASVHRQRGMAALLAGADLTLEPVTEQQLSAVGENQLPAFVRNQLTQTVAHTYKYLDPTAQLLVKAVAPQRQQGIFDAQVDTLISIGEVSLRGSASIEVNIKSGSLLGLQLILPENCNVLSVSAPSLRNHQIRPADDSQLIDLEFTREMEGQFRVQINYERIMVDSEAETAVPALAVDAAEVEHGRIAVEALTAVEVQPAQVEQLSSLDINELPQQLVLKTTNPILLAYKYVQSRPPIRLALKVTRHQELDVQVAAIEQALYQTLYTRDGLAVTRAQLDVRNSRRQFLRLELPPRSQIWSIFVDGQAEKPARTDDGDDAVLIKMINSSNGFPVDIVYATEGTPMARFGTLSGQLPRPDMIVTHSRWEVFLPAAFQYRHPDGNLDTIIAGRTVNPRTQADIEQTGSNGRGQNDQALRISVPTQGIQFSFEKLYANQSPGQAGFSIGYIAADIAQIGLFASIAGVLLIWLGIFGLSGHRMAAALVTLCIALGGLLVAGAIVYLESDPTVAAILTLIIAVLAGLRYLVKRWLDWRAGKIPEPHEYSD